MSLIDLGDSREETHGLDQGREGIFGRFKGHEERQSAVSEAECSNSITRISCGLVVRTF